MLVHNYAFGTVEREEDNCYVIELDHNPGLFYYMQKETCIDVTVPEIKTFMRGVS